jgi:hypothetical protein
MVVSVLVSVKGCKIIVDFENEMRCWCSTSRLRRLEFFEQLEMKLRQKMEQVSTLYITVHEMK